MDTGNIMKNNLKFLAIFSLALIVLLAACQVQVTPTSSATAQVSHPTPIPLPTLAEETATTAPTEAAGPAKDPSPTPTAQDADTAKALETAHAYFDALAGNNPQAASEKISTFSLILQSFTRADAADELQKLMQAGTAWSGLEVKDTQRFDADTILVHVLYQLTSKDPKTGKNTTTQKDELWPIRNENGEWLYNRGNLIDFKTLSNPDQITAGLRMKPVQITRYSDHLDLSFLVQNTTNEPIALGQSNEILAQLKFKNHTVDADKQVLVFDRLRSYPDATIHFAGLFSEYPQSAVVRQWKNYRVAPWYTFQFDD
jgi:hypothetical protein